MKKVIAFYLKNCPHCKKAFKILDELKSQKPKYSKVEIKYIEETKNPEIAGEYDYYYVPTFYVDGVKIHEGVPNYEKIEKVLQEAIK
ncbi:MAG TPA: thioredoxin family protein [Tissierellia bacterium]|jgi:thioredoxin 1|nr:thioredoxin family protein [Tissierellia bacterium]